MVNLGMFHLLDKAKSIDFSEAIACLLQQPWVVFSCQIQKAADRQLKVSTVQFATAGGEVYIFDCLTLGTQAIHEHGLAWLLQSPHLKKIMYSSDNTAAALWRQLKVQIAGTIDLQALTATPQHWPSLQYGSDPAYLDFNSDNICSASAPKSSLSASAPFPISTQVPKPADGSILNSTHQTTHHVNVDANSQKSGRRGHESPQAVLDLMLDDLESEALSSSHEIVYEFTKEAPARRSSSLQPMGGSWLCKQPQGRCSSMGSMSLLDSMQLMELPILPGEDGSVAEEYVEDKLNEGERFNWLARPLASDALDYAAAEAKTILRLYQQVSKDDKYAASIMDSQSSAQISSDTFGPFSPNSVYKQQQVERRKLLSEGPSGKSCPAPIPAKQGVDGSRQSNAAPRKPKKKTAGWRMPCLS